jgi:peptide/nickel transport system substrate-binding protein
MPKISEDGKTYTFTLREGLKYADGTPLTSQDFVRMFARLSLGGNVASLLTNYIDKVEAPDPLTVVFSLKDAYAFFPALVATAPFVPANPAQFPDGELAKLPALVDGNGAYRMLSFSAGQQMVLEANPNYWGEDKAKIKTIIIKYFDKPTTMSQAVEKGEIDIAWRILGAVEAVRLQSIETVTVTKIDAPTLRYLVFNMGYMTGQ